MTSPSVRHSLVIRHPARAAIVLVEDGQEPALPVVVTEDRHTAAVDHINAAVRARFGLTTTVLRSLFHEATPNADPIERCHELRAHNVEEIVHGAVHWCNVDALAEAAPRVWQRLLAVDAASTDTHQPRDGRDWERVGWWEEATTWIERMLRGLEGRTVTRIEQLRTWPTSCVTRVDAAGETYYFKAVARSICRECGITRYLARHFCEIAPAVIAADDERSWFLMRTARGRNLEEIDDLTQWERAVRIYAGLQLGTQGHIVALRANGCSQRSIEALAQQLAHLSAWVEGDDSTFDNAERQRWAETVTVLHRRCDQLIALPVPLLLEHGDLWPGNFLIDATTCVLIDWEEAAIAHPFWSLAPFLVGLEVFQPALATPANAARLVRAYLEPFSALAPSAQVHAAAELALPLAFCDMALRYLQYRASMVRLHPWMRDLVPQALRRVLAAVG